MKLSVVALAAGLALAAASAQAQEPPPLKYGAWGFDLAGMDRSARPGDDFFRYANGAWLDRTPIPSDKPGVSLRLYESDMTEARQHALLEAAAKAVTTPAPQTLQGKVGAFYKAFMDEGRIEALGAKPIAPELAAIRAAKTRAALGALMGQHVRAFYNAPFGVGIDVDTKDVAHYAIYLGQSGLGLPDR